MDHSAWWPKSNLRQGFPKRVASVDDSPTDHKHFQKTSQTSQGRQTANLFCSYLALMNCSRAESPWGRLKWSGSSASYTAFAFAFPMTRIDCTCSAVHESRFTDFTWNGEAKWLKKMLFLYFSIEQICFFSFFFSKLSPVLFFVLSVSCFFTHYLETEIVLLS